MDNWCSGSSMVHLMIADGWWLRVMNWPSTLGGVPMVIFWVAGEFGARTWDILNQHILNSNVTCLNRQRLPPERGEKKRSGMQMMGVGYPGPSALYHSSLLFTMLRYRNYPMPYSSVLCNAATYTDMHSCMYVWLNLCVHGWMHGGSREHACACSAVHSWLDKCFFISTRTSGCWSDDEWSWVIPWSAHHQLTHCLINTYIIMTFHECYVGSLRFPQSSPIAGSSSPIKPL